MITYKKLRWRKIAYNAFWNGSMRKKFKSVLYCGTSRVAEIYPGVGRTAAKKAAERAFKAKVSSKLKKIARYVKS
jgi:hypothetical protein